MKTVTIIILITTLACNSALSSSRLYFYFEKVSLGEMNVDEIPPAIAKMLSIIGGNEERINQENLSKSHYLTLTKCQDAFEKSYPLIQLEGYSVVNMFFLGRDQEENWKEGDLIWEVQAKGEKADSIVGVIWLNDRTATTQILYPNKFQQNGLLNSEQASPPLH